MKRKKDDLTIYDVDSDSDASTVDNSNTNNRRVRVKRANRVDNQAEQDYARLSSLVRPEQVPFLDENSVSIDGSSLPIVIILHALQTEQIDYSSPWAAAMTAKMRENAQRKYPLQATNDLAELAAVAVSSELRSSLAEETLNAEEVTTSPTPPVQSSVAASASQRLTIDVSVDTLNESFSAVCLKPFRIRTFSDDY